MYISFFFNEKEKRRLRRLKWKKSSIYKKWGEAHGEIFYMGIYKKTLGILRFLHGIVFIIVLGRNRRWKEPKSRTEGCTGTVFIGTSIFFNGNLGFFKATLLTVACWWCFRLFHVSMLTARSLDLLKPKLSKRMLALQ